MTIESDSQVPQYPQWGFSDGSAYASGWWTVKGDYVYFIVDPSDSLMSGIPVIVHRLLTTQSRKISTPWMEIGDLKMHFTDDQIEEIERLCMELYL